MIKDLLRVSGRGKMESLEKFNNLKGKYLHFADHEFYQSLYKGKILELRKEILEDIELTISPEEMSMTFKPYADYQELIESIDFLVV